MSRWREQWKQTARWVSKVCMGPGAGEGVGKGLMRQERKLSRPVGPYLWTTGPGGVVFLNREGDVARPISTMTLSASGQVDGRLGRGPVSPAASWFGTGSSTGLGSRHVTDECRPLRGVLNHPSSWPMDGLTQALGIPRDCLYHPIVQMGTLRQRQSVPEPAPDQDNTLSFPVLRGLAWFVTVPPPFLDLLTVSSLPSSPSGHRTLEIIQSLEDSNSTQEALPLWRSCLQQVKVWRPRVDAVSSGLRATRIAGKTEATSTCHLLSGFSKCRAACRARVCG